MTAVVTYMLGSLHNKRWGLYAVFFLLLTVTFIKGSADSCAKAPKLSKASAMIPIRIEDSYVRRCL